MHDSLPFKASVSVFAGLSFVDSIDVTMDSRPLRVDNRSYGRLQYVFYCSTGYYFVQRNATPFNETLPPVEQNPRKGCFLRGSIC